MIIDLSLPLMLEKPLASGSPRDEALARLGHTGTHLDRILGSAIPIEYTKSRGVLIDVSAFSRQRETQPGDLPTGLVRAGDFVLFRTGAIRRHAYGSPDYRREHVALSWKTIDSLVESRVRFIGVDARAIRPDEDHRDADSRCEQAGAYVIENLTGLEALPEGVPFTVYTAWFDLGGSGIPCRVTAEI